MGLSTRVLLAVVPAALLSCLLGACGSDDESPEEAYAEDLEELDADFNRRFNEDQPEGAAEILDQFENNYADLVEGLGVLEPPEAVREEHESYEQAAKDVLTIVEEARTEVEGGTGLFAALLEGDRGETWAGLSERCLQLEEAVNDSGTAVDLECVEVTDLPA